MKIGVLGGTFDPVHNGHLRIAEEARTALGLAQVIFIPAGQPLLKPEQPLTSAEHRVRMLQLAIAGSPHFELSLIEVERSGPSYAVDTVATLQAKASRGDEIYFIMGWDALEKLPDWREPLRLVAMCYIAAVHRPGHSKPSLEALENDIPGVSQRVFFLERPEVDISSSKIREMVREGLSIRSLVPGSVARYIKDHRLYSADQEA
jgi:nicotinate-nucleotide adenylyltransferase